MGFLGKNNSEAKAQIASLRETLVDDKKRVADELAYFQSVSRDIKKAKKRVKAAEAAFDKRENDKNASKLEAANDELTASIGAFHDSEEQIKQLLDVVHDRYSEIAELSQGRKADRVMDEFEKYHGSVLSRIIDIQSQTETDGYFESDDEEDEIMAIPEIPVANGVPANAAAPQQPAPAPAPAYAAPGAYQYPQYIPVPMPMPYSYAPQQQPAPEANQTPNIAPVSIDVSPMLEKALEATLAKFVAAFDKKIEKFVDEHPVDIPASAAPVAEGSYSGAVANAEGQVLEAEQARRGRRNHPEHHRASSACALPCVLWM